MKAILIALCLSLIGAEAQAISRHNPTRMTCDEVQATIAREGAVILRYTSPSSGLPRYDRYVASRDFCDLGEVRNRTYVPSADYRSCPVYNCKRVDFDDRRRFIFPGD
jgi:hypothetical protein